jgi:hypothetical protein
MRRQNNHRAVSGAHHLDRDIGRALGSIDAVA